MVAVQIAKLKTRNVFILILSKRHYLNLLSMPGIIPTSEENTVALDQQNISTWPKRPTDIRRQMLVSNQSVIIRHNGSTQLQTLFQQQYHTCYRLYQWQWSGSYKIIVIFIKMSMVTLLTLIAFTLRVVAYVVDLLLIDSIWLLIKLCLYALISSNAARLYEADTPIAVFGVFKVIVFLM